MISDEAVEAAAKVLLSMTGTHADEDWSHEARAALEAAAPFIREEALLEAADEFAPTVARSVLIEKPEAIYDATVNRGRDWLRARAAAERCGE